MMPASAPPCYSNFGRDKFKLTSAFRLLPNPINFIAAQAALECGRSSYRLFGFGFCTNLV